MYLLRATEKIPKSKLQRGILKHALTLTKMAQSHGSVIAIAIVFTIFALIFVQLRVRARQMKGSAFAVDDYLVMAAAVS